MKRNHLWPLLAWTTFWILFFLPILGGWQRFPTSDFTEQFHAFATFQAREMLQGRLPLWSPHSYVGVPFVADPQTAVFYLPRWITIFAAAPWGFPLYALELEALLHIWLTGAFTYALAYDLTRSRLAGLLASVIFGLGGYLVSYPTLQLAVLESITWLPLILLCIRLGVRRGETGGAMPWFVGAGLTLALSAMAGHPQTFLHVVYTAVAYYLFLTLQARWSWKPILGFGVIIALTGLATATAYWLPVLRFQPFTTRANVDYAFVSKGQPLLHNIQVLVPAVISLWSPEYWGVAGLALTLFAWLARRVDKRQTAELAFWGIFMGVAAWIALGDSGIIFQLIYHLAPGFSFFRQQERLMGLVSLAAALMAAQGLGLWLRLEAGQQQRLMRRVGVIIAGLFALTLVTLVATRAWPQPEWPGIFLRQLVLAVLVMALLWRKRWPRAQSTLLVALLVGDLYMGLSSGMSRYDASPAAYWQRPAWLETLLAVPVEDTPMRVDTRGTFWANVGEAYGWQDVSGISPLKPQALAKMERVPRPRRWQLMNVAYVVSTVPLTDQILTPEFEFSDGVIVDRPVSGMVYRVNEPYPRAWMTYEVVAVANEDEALSLLGSPDFDPRAQVILMGDTAVSIPSTPVTPPANVDAPQVHVTSPRPGWLDMDVQTPAAGYLVISEWYYPGWQVLVDGEAAELQQADVSLQAVSLAAGSHSVTLRFQPVAVPVGIAISLLALLVAIMVAWRWRGVRVTAVTYPSLTIPQLPMPHSPAWLRRKVSAGAVSSTQLYLRLMVGVTFVGYGLRVFRLGQQELRGDEGISYGYAVKSAGRIITSLRELGNPHSPLHYLSLHSWMQLTGDSEFTMRMISLIPGLLALPLAYQLGRRLVHARFGVLLAGLMAIAQPLIWQSQDLRNQYTLAIVFSLAATLALLTALQRGRWWWGLYTLFAALTVYGHTFGLFALLAHGAYVLAHAEYRRQWWRWALGGVAAALLFLPWLAYSLPGIISIGGHFSRPTTPNLANHLTDVGVELSVGTGITPEVGRWLWLGFVVLLIFGVRYLWQEKRPLAIFLLAWLGGAALGIYYMRFSRDTFNAYYISVAAPAWWALVGMGLWSLWAKRAAYYRWLALGFGTAVLLIVALSLSNYFFNPNFYRDLGYREVAAALETAVQPGDVIVPNYPDASLSYYLRHLDTPNDMQPATYQNGDGQAEANLIALAQTYDRLWFVPVHNSTWDPDDVAFHWLDYHAILESEQTYERITLAAYRPVRDDAAQVILPLNEIVNEEMLLAGAYLTVNGQPLPLQQNASIHIAPGATLELSLLWQDLTEVAQSYTVFVHVLGEDGRLIAQHDGIPAFGTRPTTTWQPGEQILDKHRVAVPPEFAGVAGKLVVGLYDSATIERQIFANEQDILWLADVEIRD